MMTPLKRITTTSCYTLLLLLTLSSYYISPSQTLNYDKLTRLYVGPSPFIENRIPILQHVNDNNNDGDGYAMNNNNKNKMQTVLEVGSRIPMTPEQSHYLNKVLRIFKKKKKNKINHNSFDDDDDAPKIRIFDGQNGEWLTKIVIQEEVEYDDDIHIHTKKRSRTRSSSLKNKKLLLFAECLEQLRPQQQNNENQHSGEPWIFFAPLHNKKRLSMMIEKCTELGTYFFFPMDTEFTSTTAISSIIQDGENEVNDNDNDDDLMGDSSSSSMDILYGTPSKNNKKKSTKNQDDTINNSVIQKLNLIAVEASEQSERLTIPFVSPYSYYASSSNNNNNNNDHPSPTSMFRLDEILAYWVNTQQQQQNNNRVLLVCRERSNKNKKALPILKILEELQHQQQLKIAFMIGPEGGWSPYEEELFDKYCVQYPNLVKSVSLGSNIILRAETAAIVAMSSYALFCDATKK